MLAANAAAHAAGRQHLRVHGPGRHLPLRSDQRATGSGRSRGSATPTWRSATRTSRVADELLGRTGCLEPLLRVEALALRPRPGGRRALQPGRLEWSATSDEKCRAPPGGRGRTAAAVFPKRKRDAMCRLRCPVCRGFASAGLPVGPRCVASDHGGFPAAGHHPPDAVLSEEGELLPFGDQAGSESTYSFSVSRVRCEPSDVIL